MRKITHLPAIWQTLGPGWLFRRVWYVATRRAGMLRWRLPAGPWPAFEDVVSSATAANAAEYMHYRRRLAPRFLFEPDDRAQYRPLFKRWDGERSPLPVANEVADGVFRYFNHAPVEVGLPPAWQRNPFSGEQAPAGAHWSQIGDFDHGDVKQIWEASRFGFTFTLVRAYWRTGDERFPHLFWQLVEDWLEQNPPQQGPNWKCGQETSIRVMAWTCGLYGFLESAATTPSRVAALAVAMAQFARRVEANLAYALNQQNNHGISEGMGLWTIGTLFPELAGAEWWRRKGRQVLEEEGRRLIDEDGAFSQHSVNYQRLMLHDYVWCLRLGDVVGQPFSAELRERVAQAGRFLASLQLGSDGETPRYGQNDGALILPLNNCSYDDYRPVLQAIHFLTSGTRRYAPGPWDEDLLWLFGPEALESPLETGNGPGSEELSAQAGGYYTIHSGESSLFVRCGRFRHRPGHADLLHADVWWQGQNVALDPGTYSYNAPPPWNNPLAATRFHNTVTVDDREQMDRIGRFLWLPWARGMVRVGRRSVGGHIVYWEGEHDGYRRLQDPVSYRRAVIGLGDHHWLVLDLLQSQSPHEYRLHWLLPDFPYEWREDSSVLSLVLADVRYWAQVGASDGAPRMTLVRADPGSPRGWYAPYYNERRPALSLAAHLRVSTVTFWSVLGPDRVRVTAGNGTIAVEAARWQAEARLAAQPSTSTTIVNHITLEGDDADELGLTA